MLTLFYYPGTCALASHIALREAGASFDLRLVDLGAYEQRQPSFLEVNPKGRVPVLQTEHGILTESLAILGFIAATNPDAGLAPLADPFGLAEIAAFNSFLASSVHVTFALERRGRRYADDEAARESLKRKVPETLDGHFDMIERQLSDGRPFIHGERYTVSDPYLFLFERWYRDRGFGSPERTPNVFRHLERIGAREATRAAIEAEEGAAG